MAQGKELIEVRNFDVYSHGPNREKTFMYRERQILLHNAERTAVKVLNRTRIEAP